MMTLGLREQDTMKLDPTAKAKNMAKAISQCYGMLGILRNAKEGSARFCKAHT